MYRLGIVLTMLGLAAGLWAGEADKNAVCRPLNIPGLPGPTDFKHRVDKPTVITNVEELAKTFKEEAVRTAIEKQVNFEKEQVIYFAWSGSGGDKLSYKIEGSKEKPEVVFQYNPGFTRDLQRHSRLFALAKNATFKITLGRGGK